ncbi:signal peptidase I [Streptomyces sp. NA04227]|uniref:signal peptidase I n=1 Tax=Streptomyces sp. NA04227 TaxID=2742136 RepID=UPI0015917BF0|nr:signal peptidase I [Streptomyces sp. NA04227]QKW09456.1 signal peptidase I [Streptomyces sp. NA04227]
MGDLAVGARSGHEGPEERPENRQDPPLTPPPSEQGRGSAESAHDVPGASVPGPAAEFAAGNPGEPAPEPADDGEGDGRAARRRRRQTRSFWKELPLLIVIALVLALVIKTFLVQAFSIPSDSMQNTLQQGDRVLVDKLTPWFGSEPERGEVIVFHDPDNWLAGEPTTTPNALQTVLSKIGLMPSADEKDLIKRVIGVAGDTVECKGTGPLKVNGKPLDEPYIYPGNTPCTVDELGGQFKVIVPNGKVWVMGDHRQNSLDSRYHQKDKYRGMVPVDQVVGRAVVIAWPPTRWDTLPVPDAFDKPGLSSAMATAPGAVGLAGAIPLVLWRRRRLLARDSRVSATSTAG